MANDAIYVGIELARASIHVAASGGQRVTVRGIDGRDPGEWLELALHGLAGLPATAYATIAVPVAMPAAARDAIVRAGRSARFEGAFTCASPHALARGRDLVDACTAVVVDDDATSIGLVRGGAPTDADLDVVRRIPGREAREIAVAVRCLLKPHPRDAQRRLLRRVTVAGDEAELDRIGRSGLVRELEAIGARVEVVSDPFTVAAGAERLARELDPGAWRRLASSRGRTAS